MNHFTDFFKLPSRMGKGVIFCHFFPQEQMPELLFGRFLSKSYINYEKKMLLMWIHQRKRYLANFDLNSTNLCLSYSICALDIFMFEVPPHKVREQVTKDSVFPCAQIVNVFK